jgi:DNA-directed RNA polymerase specialized sigma24 family protein
MTGPRPDRQPWTPEDDNLLLELFEAGMTAPEIAKQLKRPAGSVRSRKHRLKERCRAFGLAYRIVS